MYKTGVFFHTSIPTVRYSVNSCEPSEVKQERTDCLVSLVFAGFLVANMHAIGPAGLGAEPHLC